MLREERVTEDSTTPNNPPKSFVSDDDYLTAIEKVREAKLYRDHCLSMLRGADKMEEEAYAELDKLRRVILAETMGRQSV